MSKVIWHISLRSISHPLLLSSLNRLLNTTKKLSQFVKVAVRDLLTSFCYYNIMTATRQISSSTTVTVELNSRNKRRKEQAQSSPYLQQDTNQPENNENG